jgi:F0F1-type ATP synthase assembly protein I
MKSKVFPENPFVFVFAKIATIDAVIILISVAIAIWKSEWMWMALGGGLVLSIIVFVVLNKQYLKSLSCPKCKTHIAFEAGQGFVCKKCNIGWEMN